MDPLDPAWIEAQEHHLGIRDHWLSRHIEESVRLGRLPAREGGDLR